MHTSDDILSLGAFWYTVCIPFWILGVRKIRIAVSNRMKRRFRELAELYGVEVYEGDEG